MKKLPFLLIASLMASATSFATIVEFQTSHGNFQVNLHDQTTPKTVANFLNYVTSDKYDDTIIHRVVPDFVVQGGGHFFDGQSIKSIETNDPVTNEPVYSNVKGTIAMAKLDKKPHSATSQWFINTKSNINLDTSNGGFTVFGEVVGDGMAVIEEIEKLSLCASIPMPNFSANQCSSGEIPGTENFVNVYDIIIIDDANNTADTLSPVKNTANGAGGGGSTDNGGNSSGGSLWYLLGLLAIGVRSKLKNSLRR